MLLAGSFFSIKSIAGYNDLWKVPKGFPVQSMYQIPVINNFKRKLQMKKSLALLAMLAIALAACGKKEEAKPVAAPAAPAAPAPADTPAAAPAAPAAAPAPAAPADAKK